MAEDEPAGRPRRRRQPCPPELRGFQVWAWHELEPRVVAIGVQEGLTDAASWRVAARISALLVVELEHELELARLKRRRPAAD